MRIIRIVFLLMLVSLMGEAQSNADNIVVLVDVSKPITEQIKKPIDIANVIQQIILRQPIDKEFRFEKPFDAGNESLIQKGNKIFVMSFGDKTTDNLSKSIRTTTIGDQVGHDLFMVLKEYPREYKDTKALVALAQGRAAQQAKISGMESYWLFLVTSTESDTEEPTDYSSEQDTLAKIYHSDLAAIMEDKGTVTYGKDKKLQIKIYKVNIETAIIPQPCQLQFLSFQNGTAKTPILIENSKVDIRWNSCSGKVEYTVNIVSLDGAKIDRKIGFQRTFNNFLPVNLEAGKYKIIVKAPDTDSITTYIEVNTGSNLIAIIVGILIVAGIGFGIYKYFDGKPPKPKAYTNTGIPPKKNQKNDDDEI